MFLLHLNSVQFRSLRPFFQSEFLAARLAVIKLQRWWRAIKVLREIDASANLPPPVRLPKVRHWRLPCCGMGSERSMHLLLLFLLLQLCQVAEELVKKRERLSLDLLIPVILDAQGVFSAARHRAEIQYILPLRLQVYHDCRSIYPRTWAQPFHDLVSRILVAASAQQESQFSERVTQTRQLVVSRLLKFVQWLLNATSSPWHPLEDLLHLCSQSQI